MAVNGIGVVLKTEFKDATKAITDMQKAPHKATLWALRDAARLTRGVAKKDAPAYKGKNYPSISGGIGKKGALRRSIRVAKHFKEADPVTGRYTIRVFPYGLVYKYRAQQEERVGFMQSGRNAAAEALPELYTRSIRKALKL